MNIRQYLLVLALGTCAAVMAWCMVLLSINPLTAGVPGITAFYATLSLAVLGIVATLGTTVRMRRLKSEDDAEVVRVIVRSLRQGALLAVLVVGALLLQRAYHFSLILFVFMVLAIGIIEFLLLFLEERQVARLKSRG